MLDRLEIEDLQYNNFDTPLSMTAFTKPFKTQVEFESTGQSQVNSGGEIENVTNVLDKLDFGIAERPREDLFVQKTINNFRIVLANGQELAAGNPKDSNANMNYTKAVGFNQVINSGEAARNALPKQLIVELDAELIQGARVEIEYAVKVTNNNDLDYDYGIDTDYTDIVDGDIVGRKSDEYITKSPKASYYYYGDSTGLNPIQTTLEFIDYIDNELVYEEDTTKWIAVNKNDLDNYNNKLINNEACKIVNSGEYLERKNLTKSLFSS
jgi:hypothetical protein